MEAADRANPGAARSDELCHSSGLSEAETSPRDLHRFARTSRAITRRRKDLDYPSRPSGRLVETEEQDEAGLLARRVANRRRRKPASAVGVCESGRRSAGLPPTQVTEATPGEHISTYKSCVRAWK